jgi:Ca-activated chloride channel family protein
MILGIAGPKWGMAAVDETAPGRDIVVVLDLSRSMLAPDVLGRADPNRAGAAIDAARHLADHVRRRGGHRLALVVFAARARIACPLTHDYNHFEETLGTLQPADAWLEIGPSADDSPSGTRIGAALKEAVELFDASSRGFQDILLLSDGDDPVDDHEWREGISAAKQRGIPVYTIGLGDPENATPIPTEDRRPLMHAGLPVVTKLQEAPLQEIARETRGEYVSARTGMVPLADIFRRSIEKQPSREPVGDSLPMYRQHSSWCFGLAFVLLALRMLCSDCRFGGRGAE